MFSSNLFSKPLYPQAQPAQTMGIISLVCLVLALTCGCTGIISIVLGFMAVAKAKKVKNDVLSNPSAYHIDSLQKADSAKTMGLIGGILGIVFNALGLMGLFIMLLINYFENMG